MKFRCVDCAYVTDSDSLAPICARCGSSVLPDVARAASVSRSDLEGFPPGVWRYRDFLPEVGQGGTVTLGEGGTPMLHAHRLGDELGLSSLLIKDESRNPTGSFMDRGTTVLVSLAKERGVGACSCVTTGNLGASLAAYCAKAGMDAHIQIKPDTDQGKLYQMLAYGAEVATENKPSHGMKGVAVTAGNPLLLQGEKTTGFEMAQDLGWRAPDVVVVPVGTGGHLSMIWQSMVELRSAGLLDGEPSRLLGVQLTEAVPGATRKKAAPPEFQPAELAESERFYTGEAARAISNSRGFLLTTTAAETVTATGLLAKTEGIFAEPSAASVIPALAHAVRDGLIGRRETVACVVTGAGLKDPRAVSRLARETKRASPTERYGSAAPLVGRTKVELLRLLQEGPSYGYGLWQAIRSERPMSTASVYQHLLELEGFAMVRKKGSIVSGGRERILYELTRRGGDLLKVAGKMGDLDRGRRPRQPRSR